MIRDCLLLMMITFLNVIFIPESGEQSLFFWT